MENPEEKDLSHDWFLPSIFVDGSLNQFFESVCGQITHQLTFLQALQKNLLKKNNGELDRISKLAEDIRQFELTHRLRLSLLQVEREAPWYRPTSQPSLGPFNHKIFCEPVLSRIDSKESKFLRQKIEQMWHDENYSKDKKTIFKDGVQTLWDVLFSLKSDFNDIAVLRLSKDLAMRLDLLPENLPWDLECRSLRAFLVNIQNKLLECRTRLDDLYKNLLQMSEKFWEHHKKDNWRTHASEFREEMRKERMARQNYFPVKTLKALKDLGFDDLPTTKELKQRFHDLAKKWHPDKETGDEKVFKQITFSYEYLQTEIGKSKSLN